MSGGQSDIQGYGAFHPRQADCRVAYRTIYNTPEVDYAWFIAGTGLATITAKGGVTYVADI